jgi:hypothetical protein
LAVALLALAACGDTDRTDYRDDMAEANCARLQECGEIGPEEGQRYEDVEDCLLDKLSDFNDFWPASKCDDGRINEAKFEECHSRISTLSCDTGGAFIDSVAFVSECNAEKVCID